MPVCSLRQSGLLGRLLVHGFGDPSKGPKHGVTVDIFTLTRPGRRVWSLMVIREYWWAGAENKPLKSLGWARPTGGQRGDILSWLRAQEPKVGREAFSKRLAGDAGDDEPVAIEDDGIA